MQDTEDRLDKLKAQFFTALLTDDTLFALIEIATTLQHTDGYAEKLPVIAGEPWQRSGGDIDTLELGFQTSMSRMVTSADDNVVMSIDLVAPIPVVKTSSSFTDRTLLRVAEKPIFFDGSDELLRLEVPEADKVNAAATFMEHWKAFRLQARTLGAQYSEQFGCFSTYLHATNN